jgi:hypothetical protein
MDGLNYGADLVEKNFPDAVRTACGWHMTNASDKHAKTNLHVGNEQRAVVKRCLDIVRRGPCGVSVVALWRFVKDLVTALYPDDTAVQELLNYLDRTYLNRSKKDDFGWFASFCARKILDDPHGPIAGCTTNAIESFWHVIKAALRAMALHHRPRTVQELHVFISHIFDQYFTKTFKFSNNLLDDMEKMLLAGRERFWTIYAHEATHIPLPDSDSRVFLLSRESRLLVGLEDQEAALLMTEQVHNLGAHRNLSDDEFEEKVPQIDGQRLFVALCATHIIRFHEDHPAGTIDSFAYAICQCRSGTRTGCHHALAVHQLMWTQRNAAMDPRIDPTEYYRWPSREAVSDRFNLAGNFVPRAHVPDEDFVEMDLLTTEVLEEWQEQNPAYDIFQILERKFSGDRAANVDDQAANVDDQSANVDDQAEEVDREGVDASRGNAGDVEVTERPSNTSKTAGRVPTKESRWKMKPRSDMETLEALGIRASKAVKMLKPPKKESAADRKSRLADEGISKLEAIIKSLQTDVKIKVARAPTPEVKVLWRERFTRLNSQLFDTH